MSKLQLPETSRSCLFLGLISHYRKFIPNAVTILAPLNELFPKDATWSWTEECQHSFDKAKEILASSKVLMHYDPTLPIWIAGDDSAYGV